jgi:uncharacterized membrane protein YgcG
MMTRRTSILLISAFLAVGLAVCHSMAGDDPQTALQKQVPKFSTNGTLDETMAKLSDASGLKIVIDWKAMETTGIDRKATVVYSTSNATVEQLIEMALARAAVREHPLAWYMEGDVVRVTTQAKVLYRHDLPVAENTPAHSASAKDSAPARNVKFDNSSLADVLSYVRDISKVNLTVNWKSLEDSGITKETQVTIEARNLTHAQLLDMVLDQVNGDKDKLSRAYWVAHNGVVTIATGNALNNETVTKVVDVSDLLMPVPNMQGPVLDLSQSSPTSNGGSGGSSSGGGSSGGGLFGQQSSNSNSASAPEEDLPTARQKLRDNLVQAVKDSIGDDMWKPDGKGSITLLGSKMVISQTLLGFKLMENAGRK